MMSPARAVFDTTLHGNVTGRRLHRAGGERMSRPVERISIGLVGCAATKAETAAPARRLYISDLFRKASAYAEATYDLWRIMSAQHYLLHPDEVIEPYDKRVDRMPKWEREHWASMVESGLRCGHNYCTEGRVRWRHRDYPELRLGEWMEEGRELGIDRHVDLSFHFGAAYVDPVRRLMETTMRDVPYDVHAPLASMGIGQQLAWYKRQAAAGPVRATRASSRRGPAAAPRPPSCPGGLVGPGRGAPTGRGSARCAASSAPGRSPRPPDCWASWA